MAMEPLSTASVPSQVVSWTGVAVKPAGNSSEKLALSMPLSTCMSKESELVPPALIVEGEKEAVMLGALVTTTFELLAGPAPASIELTVLVVTA